MIREIHTIKEAAQEWVRGMNAIPTELLQKIAKLDINEFYDSIHELTTPVKGNPVYVYDLPDTDIEGLQYTCDDSDGVITGYDEETEEYIIELSGGTRIKCEAANFEVNCDDEFLPMWGTLWTFGDSADDYWLTNCDGIRKMSECGFRIYESDDFGYFFGIDGAGYDFYEAHWIPLYKARGLQWHDTEENEAA